MFLSIILNGEILKSALGYVRLKRCNFPRTATSPCGRWTKHTVDFDGDGGGGGGCDGVPVYWGCVVDSVQDMCTENSGELTMNVIFQYCQMSNDD